MGIYDRFFPKSKADPRAKELLDRPSYWLGDDFTPRPQEIDGARKRQEARRKDHRTQWRRALTDTELNAARAAVVCAADRREGTWPREDLRPIRPLIFDRDAEFWIRNLAVSDERYLIDFRHPLIASQTSDLPIGLRVLGLSQIAWKRRDDIGIMFDGRELPVAELLGLDWQKTFIDPNLAETYIRFVFDHVVNDGYQIYLVSDDRDFILNANGSPPDRLDYARTLTAQLRFVVESNADAPSDSGRLFGALGIDEEALIPPTAFGFTHQSAKVFATAIVSGQLLHVSLRINQDWVIEAQEIVLQTPEGKTLPLAALRSFEEQTRAIKALKADATSSKVS